jgi:penicillin-binding protein 2
MLRPGEDRESFHRRLQAAFIAAAFCFGAMAACYWYLQVVRGRYYFRLSENNRLRSVAVTAARGMIYDRDGAVLAENEPAYSLYLYRRETRNLRDSLDTATRLLALDPEDVARRVARYRLYFDFVPIDLADDLTLPEVATIEAHLVDHPEFAIGVVQRRRYGGALAAQTLGYLSEATPDQLAAAGDRYRPGELVGQRGIESAYQDLLAGRDGERRIIVDSFGHETAEERREDPLPGRNLSVTLDERLQETAERYLDGRVGAAVAMDPRNGEILAMASAPTYDPNLFSTRMTPAQWSSLIASPFHPLQNRAIQNVYSPGSVFKVFLAEGALAGGYITPDTRVYCPGYATFFGRTFRCHKREGHGWVALRDAIKMSCDVYFYTLGKKLGIERISEIARSFGFGEKTQLDLPNEKSGLVPSEDWSRRVRRSPWYPSETISVAIGQGPLLVSTVQIARALSGLIEGGRFARPHLFRSAEDPRTGERWEYVDGAEQRLQIPHGVVDAIKDGMCAVVNEPGGTAYLSRIPELEFCGKTGSVQVVAQKDTRRSGQLPYDKRDHAWFAGFAPRKDPRIVVVVFIEHGEHGSSAAAPLARDLVRAYFGLAPAEPAPRGEAPVLVAQRAGSVP